MEVLEVQGQERAQGQEATQGRAYLLAVIDRILDKGLVLEEWSSVRVLGVEVLTLDLRAVVASFTKYLDYAEAMERLAPLLQPPRADVVATDDGEQDEQEPLLQP